MSAHDISAKVAAISTTMSPYPASFNNDPWLYGASLASLMAISMFLGVVGSWMARDIWRDRFTEHPLTPVFLFRLMIMTISLTGLIRCLPEVAYMTLYGEVTGSTMSAILSVKRVADVMALPTVVGWTSILVLIYPFVIVSLKSHRSLSIGIDPFAIWHRLVRPACILVTILILATLMALAKGSLASHG